MPKINDTMELFVHNLSAAEVERINGSVCKKYMKLVRWPSLGCRYILIYNLVDYPHARPSDQDTVDRDKTDFILAYLKEGLFEGEFSFEWTNPDKVAALYTKELLENA